MNQKIVSGSCLSNDTSFYNLLSLFFDSCVLKTSFIYFYTRYFLNAVQIMYMYLLVSTMQNIFKLQDQNTLTY